MNDSVATKHDLELAGPELKGERQLNPWMLALVNAATVIPLICDLL